MAQAGAMIETANLNEFEKPIEEALAILSKEKIILRIWEKDWTVWKNDPREISNRLGWLTLPQRMEKELSNISQFIHEVRKKGFTHALLLGMGGSSLAPLVLKSVFKTAKGYLDLEILDSTDPAAVLHLQNKLNPKKALIIVSSKSGTTVETISFFKFFWNWIAESLGEDRTGEHFLAITDPGTPLEDLAQCLRFGAVFLGGPEIGGRFSALSPFGLVPSALKGIKIPEILKTAKGMAGLCRKAADLKANPGAYLGTILGILTQRGYDKVTFLLSPRLESFGLWLEQLIAESTGKEGKGMLPVEGEPIGPAKVYGRDRLFVYIKERGDNTNEAVIKRLKSAGFPMLLMTFPAIHHFGSQFFLWEFATAVAGIFLRINPFDQPNVESAKKKTQEMLGIYRQQGTFAEENPSFEAKGISLFSDIQALSLGDCLKSFLGQARPGDYLAIQAFLAPKRQTAAALQKLRVLLRERTRRATTVGYGPRFLHSTGQLHKGDRGNGLFIQITCDDEKDAAIPDEPGSSSSTISFGVLKAAQARGDFEALKSSGRRIIRLHVGKDTGSGLEKIIKLFR
jgi:glucose-6-phosphate isomerase/transaldolase/glucose-6-phosphate isomerase